MRVLVVGSGAREHALAAALGRTAEVVVAPGNAGIAGSVAADPLDVEADLVVIGPEAPLVDGLADRLRAKGRLVFGPGADGARLEGSKKWMKALLDDAKVPTARSLPVTDVEAARRWLDSVGPPFVVKTDGLAAGKGVLVTSDRAEALDDVAAKLSGSAFGDAGRTVVLEEGLTGPELSVTAVCDGTTAVALPTARDHKRVGDGDTGPNTGGMGAYSPVDLPEGVEDEVMERAVLPTLHALRGRGIDYRGVLYAGLMLTPDGPRIVEFNVRFGDPEAEALFPRVTGDLTEWLASAAAGRLGPAPAVTDQASVCVVCSVEGYPTAPRYGDPVTGVEDAAAEAGTWVFCAGVGPGFVTAGGRVLAVTAVGPDVGEARDRAYRAIGKISFRGMHYRRDIASDAT